MENGGNYQLSNISDSVLNSLRLIQKNPRLELEVSVLQEDLKTNTNDERAVFLENSCFEMNGSETQNIICSLIPGTQINDIFFEPNSIPVAVVYCLTKESQTIRLKLNLTNTDTFDYQKGWNVGYSQDSAIQFTNWTFQSTIPPRTKFIIELVGYYDINKSLRKRGEYNCIFNFRNSNKTNKLKHDLTFRVRVI